MKNGKLNQQERRTLWRAVTILNTYCDWASDHGRGVDETGECQNVYSSASNAVGCIADFLYEQRVCVES